VRFKKASGKRGGGEAKRKEEGPREKRDTWGCDPPKTGGEGGAKEKKNRGLKGNEAQVKKGLCKRGRKVGGDGGSS